MEKSTSITSLKDNFLGIDQIIQVPNRVRDIVVENLNNFDTSKMNFTDRQSFNNLTAAIKNIDVDNIRKGYSLIYNDVCVLAVSALSAELEKYFVDHINSNLSKIPKIVSDNLKEIKFSLDDARIYNFNIRKRVGEFILTHGKGISFQDLQSILRNFQKYCGKIYEPREDIKNAIIFYQQCRNSIVHKNGIVDEEFVLRVGKPGKPTNLKYYALRDKIELEQEDWNIMQAQFIGLLEGLIRA